MGIDFCIEIINQKVEHVIMRCNIDKKARHGRRALIHPHGRVEEEETGNIIKKFCLPPNQNKSERHVRALYHLH
jgi:hypothetical protein